MALARLRAMQPSLDPEPELLPDQDSWDGAKQNGNTLVLFVWGDWCGVCKEVTPKFDDLSSNYSNLSFLTADYNGFIQDNDDVMDGLSKVPTFQIWQGGSKVEQIVGGDMDAVEAMIQKYN